MKKIFVLTLALSVASVITFAQISTKQLPRSFKLENVKISKGSTLVLSTPDVDMFLNKEQQEANLFKPSTCALLIPVNENFFDRAEKISLSDADIYMLKVKSEGALALNLYSDNFYIPKNCELYLWNPTKTKCLGAFTSDNNSDDGCFSTDYVYEDEMIIEYYQPKTVKENAKLNIKSIGYFFRDVINFEKEMLTMEEDNNGLNDAHYKDFNESESCNVNINCSEGNNFRNVQRSVVRMLIPVNNYQAAWCSGALINNTSNDMKPYVFSAAHCIESVESSICYSYIQFYFNYEFSGCSKSSTEPSYTMLTGAKLLTYGKKFGRGDSDYLLLQINKKLPKSANAFWAGWTTETTLFNGCVGIHHPSGDVKKISTVDGAIKAQGLSDTMWIAQTHRCVKWKKTGNGYGIVEQGSSGSPLFNSSGQIIGSLSGGVSSCSVPDYKKVDWYGRFDVSFEYIKKWIDPNNSNSISLNGRDYTSGIVDAVKSDMKISVSPNPAMDNIVVSIKGLKDKGVVAVLDRVGRTVYSTEVSPNTNVLNINVNVNVNNFVKGVYFVRLYSQADAVIEKIIVQ